MVSRTVSSQLGGPSLLASQELPYATDIIVCRYEMRNFLIGSTSVCVTRVRLEEIVIN